MKSPRSRPWVLSIPAALIGFVGLAAATTHQDVTTHRGTPSHQVPPSRQESGFLPHDVDADAHGTASLHACDVDRDGDNDLVGAVMEEDAVVWWRNEGGSPLRWVRHDIGTSFTRAISVYCADMNGDGWPDILGAAAWGDEIALWISGGGDSPSWEKQTIRSGYDFAHEVYAHDLDQDGDQDILAASTRLNSLTWWRNDGGLVPRWVEQSIDSAFTSAKSLRVADFDGDGDNDVAGAALNGNEVAWWRNDGGAPPLWTKISIDPELHGAHRVEPLDMDFDGDVDVLAAAYHGSEVVWYQNPGRRGGPWEKHTIATEVTQACIASAADFDGDGRWEVAASAQNGNRVDLWRRVGEDGGWSRLPVDGLTRVWPLVVADLDGDGDPDIAAGSGFEGVNEVRWYENLRISRQPGSRPESTFRAQRHSLIVDSRLLGEARSIDVRLPDACRDAGAACPVLYLLDGESSAGMLAVVDSLTRSGEIPEMILVAIPNTHRVRDLSPSPTEERRSGGGAPRFLRFIEEELIPEIERAYAPGPPRIIFGHSLGGLFSTYALVAGSSYFDGFIASSPPLDWGDYTIRRMAHEAVRGSPGWEATFLLSAGTEEWVHFQTSTRDFAEWLEEHAPEGLNWRYRVHEGEDHGSVGYVALADGLLRIFSR